MNVPNKMLIYSLVRKFKVKGAILYVTQDRTLLVEDQRVPVPEINID
jgi:hypothetical protein